MTLNYRIEISVIARDDKGIIQMLKKELITDFYGIKIFPIKTNQEIRRQQFIKIT